VALAIVNWSVTGSTVTFESLTGDTIVTLGDGGGGGGGGVTPPPFPPPPPHASRKRSPSMSSSESRERIATHLLVVLAW
jgi:hypothetical protein